MQRQRKKGVKGILFLVSVFFITTFSVLGLAIAPVNALLPWETPSSTKKGFVVDITDLHWQGQTLIVDVWLDGPFSNAVEVYAYATPSQNIVFTPSTPETRPDGSYLYLIKSFELWPGGQPTEVAFNVTNTLPIEQDGKVTVQVGLLGVIRDERAIDYSLPPQSVNTENTPSLTPTTVASSSGGIPTIYYVAIALAIILAGVVVISKLAKEGETSPPKNDQPKKDLVSEEFEEIGNESKNAIISKTELQLASSDISKLKESGETEITFSSHLENHMYYPVKGLPGELLGVHFIKKTLDNASYMYHAWLINDNPMFLAEYEEALNFKCEENKLSVRVRVTGIEKGKSGKPTAKVFYIIEPRNEDENQLFDSLKRGTSAEAWSNYLDK